MKKYVLILSLITSSLIGQNIKYSFSEEFETVKKYRDKGFYKLNKNEYVEAYMQKDEEDMVFQVFDKNMSQLKKTETAALPKLEKHPVDEGFFSVKNDFFWFYSTWDRKSETERLFARPFDPDFLKFDSKEIKLIETSRLGGGDKYSYNYSTDSTKMLITYRLKAREKRDALNKDIIGFNLFDDKMNKLYAAEIEMPYSEADMDNLDYEIDSKGNIYMLISVKINNSIDGEVAPEKENRNARRFELVRVNQKNNTLQALKINLENKMINSVILSEDLNHDIIIAGYYSDRKYSNSANGAYIIRLEYDANNSVKSLKTTYCEFPAATLKAYESERTKRKMDKKDNNSDLEAANLSLQKIAFYPDGSVMIIGEEYYVVQHTHRSGNTTYTTYTYYYNDILALKADKNGKTIWCNKIPKYQSGSGTMDLSFCHHTFKGEDYFFYLDNKKNMDLALTETPAPHSSGRGGYLTCVKIGSDGKMIKKSIFDIRDEEVRIFPRYFESLSENLIVDRVRAEKKTSKIFKLEIN